MSDSDAKKLLLRHEMKRRRAALAQADGLAGDRMAETVSSALEAWPRRGSLIAGYYPIQSEINPFPLLQIFEDKGYRLCLPCLVAGAEGYEMRFRAFRLGDDLEQGPFDIHQPHAAAGEVTPDVVLVPLLAFTRDGHRLGYGGGYYDRALAALRAQGDVRVCGIAFSGQELADLPFEVHDQKLDDIWTEQGVIEARAQA
ncbi:5-formyltetrahydrofolate cyclo-ligase [Asticcacaulis sp. EMRT-3]|uniref:5-formyltetrahydrofolate cyclo-ligase n=1 Tax=Asticcacaulis sp. EMRT-3 TaxID=3040349 RepID=UPI0024AF4EDC|nr:5-formyltetrahydrofolate cyclo-ligase [Asticcacaulis sp. EMRT-3]MDI7776306.1 5-formyltetrahydrofolate cyclo-ligase [Asticcacaulis sp. EMRT-3]